MNDNLKPLKDAFLQVVSTAAEIEKSGHTIPGNYFNGTIRDYMLREHIDLVAANPQYSDLYKAFKSTKVEIAAFAKGLCECDSHESVKKYFDGQSALGLTDDALNAKYEQQEEALFVMFQQSYYP